mgnify:CR=1 FL=1
MTSLANISRRLDRLDDRTDSGRLQFFVSPELMAGGADAIRAALPDSYKPGQDRVMQFDRLPGHNWQCAGNADAFWRALLSRIWRDGKQRAI